MDIPSIIKSFDDERLETEVAAFHALIMEAQTPAARASLLGTYLPLCIEWEDRLWRETLCLPSRKEEQASERKWLDERERRYQAHLRKRK